MSGETGGGLTAEEREPDPIGDIAESIGVTHPCDNSRECAGCRHAATLIWLNSPGHREAWYGQAQRRLAVAIKDVCWRAQQYGQTEDGDTFAYLVTKGAMHRLIGAAQGAGISASFRADSSETLPDADRLADANARLAAVEARTEAAFAGIRCALLHWQPEGVTEAVSCANCQSWAKSIAMPFFRAALHPDPSPVRAGEVEGT